MDGEADRWAYDDAITKAMVSNELKEQQSKEKMTPTDLELQEERLEDENEAKLERAKHLQYLPDYVLYRPPPRPRPVVIALSRCHAITTTTATTSDC